MPLACCRATQATWCPAGRLDPQLCGKVKRARLGCLELGICAISSSIRSWNVESAQVVDLDLPPEQRWAAAMKDAAEPLKPRGEQWVWGFRNLGSSDWEV